MHRDFNKNYWSKVALFFLMITSLLGYIIRIIPLQTIIDSSYFYGILQSHSHTGFLGWVFIAIYIIILNRFGNSEIFQKKKTKLVLFLLTFFIGGMTLSFPLFGYNFISISFLSLFLAFSYYSLYYLYKNIKEELKTTISFKYIKYGFLLYLLSSISPWLLGPIMALGYKKTPLYYNDIFFYLHFLYNGFVIFSIIGIFFIKREISSNQSPQLKTNSQKSFRYFLWGTILNYSASTLWTKPHISIYIIAFISSILLIVAMYRLWKIIKQEYNLQSNLSSLLLRISLLMFVLKVLMQVIQPIPEFAEISYNLKGQLIIGYIHLVTLGLITPFIISFFIKDGFLNTSRLLSIGVYSYIIGFITTELLLFGQGILLWNGITNLSYNFNLYMAISSTFLFLGFLLIYLASYKKK